MKRSLWLFLTIMLVSLLLLSACGSDDEETEETVPADETEQEETTETEDEEDTSSTDTEEDTDTETETEESNESETDSTDGENQVVEENEVFRLFEPAPDTVVDNQFTVRGEAQVYDGTVHYEFEDGHNILDEGSVTASREAPDWGEFELTIQFDEVAFNTGTIILYEEDENGTRQNQLYIPVTVE